MTSTELDNPPAAGGSRPPSPTVARYVVASQTAPPLTAGVAVAEKVREALQKHSDGAAVFSGKTVDGRPLSGHEHAFIFYEAGRNSGIRHITLYAAMGFDDRAQTALDRLVKVWGHGGDDLHLALTGIGRRRDFAGRNTAAGQCPLLDEARTWISHTPFVPTRHAKAKLDARGLQIGTPEHDLRRLVGERFPEPVDVSPLRETVLDGRPVPWSAFGTRRGSGGGRRSTAAGYGFRVEFAGPVRGPIAVGYAAHFGLGVFTPAAGDGGSSS